MTGNDAKTVFKSQRSLEVPLFKVESLMCGFERTRQVACNYEEYRPYRRDTMAYHASTMCGHRGTAQARQRIFHVVPARWHSCGPACCRARANPPPRQRLGEEEEEAVTPEEEKAAALEGRKKRQTSQSSPAPGAPPLGRSMAPWMPELHHHRPHCRARSSPTTAEEEGAATGQMRRERRRA